MMLAVDKDSLWVVVGVPIASLIIGLIAGYVGQLYFAPRVARKERARQRWDEYAAEVGDIVTGRYMQVGPQYVVTARSLAFIWREFQEGRATRKDVDEVIDAFQAAYLEISTVWSRLYWLVDRLINGYGAPRNVRQLGIELGHFEKAVESARKAFDPTQSEGPRSRIDFAQIPTPEDWDALSDDLLASVQHMLGAVIEAADGK